MKRDFSKLLGRIRELRFTQKSLAKALDMSPSTLSLKLNGKATFTAEEIDGICKCLDISSADVGAYFFAQ